MESFRYESPIVPIVTFDGYHSRDIDAIERTRADILKRNPERATAFGRSLPAFRAAAVKQLIDETSAANAQFSLVSNIPAMLPVIGNIAAAGADFIVLTKNQVMMLYKLAAVHGRDLHNQRGILQEVLPVVGAGLVADYRPRGISPVALRGRDHPQGRHCLRWHHGCRPCR